MIFKMAGKRETLKPMWAILRRRLDLDDPVPMSGHVYLGCGQEDVAPNEPMVQSHNRQMQEIMYHEGKGQPSADQTDHGEAQLSVRGGERHHPIRGQLIAFNLPV